MLVRTIGPGLCAGAAVALSACAHAPVSEWAHTHLATGIAYLQQGQCEQAEERCRLALEYGDAFPEAHNCLGLVRLRCHRDLDRAAAHFKDAVAIDGDFAEAHQNLGAVSLLRDPPDYATACESSEAALEIDPGLADARENLGVCLMRRGIAAGEQGDPAARHELFARARSQLIRLLEIAPLRPSAWQSLGLMSLVSERLAEARASFTRCLELAPDDSTCSYNLGLTALALSDCRAAVGAFVGALRAGDASPVAIEARKGLQRAQAECAREDAALEEYLALARARPSDPRTRFDLGGMLADRGLLDEAAKAWDEAIQLDASYCPPYHRRAQYAHDALDSTATVAYCRAFIACAAPSSELPEEIGWCREMIEALE